MLKEFREFAIRGNVMDLAVGIILGVAFGKIVSSLVADVLTPPLGLLLGGVDFSGLVLTLKEAVPPKPAVVIAYGKLLQAVFDFVIIAFAIFQVVRVMNRMKREAPPAAPPAPSAEAKLLGEIRDLLRQGR